MASAPKIFLVKAQIISYKARTAMKLMEFILWSMNNITKSLQLSTQENRRRTERLGPYKNARREKTCPGADSGFIFDLKLAEG